VVRRTFTFVSVQHGQHSEDEGTEGRSKESSPIVSHREERGSDFDAEQNTWDTHTMRHDVKIN